MLDHNPFARKSRKTPCRLAKKAGRTKTAIAREAILEYIEDLEDCHAAERCMRRIHLGKERTCTLEEVENHLGLKD
ncbi:MAG: type II toxin-antitoxin system RelB family antitoxin [Gammaproteobacteria bacterium]